MAQTHKNLRGNKRSKRGFRKLNKTPKRKQIRRTQTKRRQTMRRRQMTKKRTFVGGASMATDFNDKIMKLMKLMPDKPQASLQRAFKKMNVEEIENMTPSDLNNIYKNWRDVEAERRKTLRMIKSAEQPQPSIPNKKAPLTKRERETYDLEPSDESMPEVHMENDIIPFDPENPYDPKNDLKDMQDWDVPVIQPKKKKSQQSKSWMPPKVHSTETRPFDPYGPNDPHNDLQEHMHWDEEIPQGQMQDNNFTPHEHDFAGEEDHNVKLDWIDENEAAIQM